MPKHKTFALLAALILAILAAVALAACGSTSTSSGSATTITLYNGQHEQTTAKLVAGFEKQTGIKVKVRSDDEDVLGNQILQEGASSPADVFYTENTPVLEDLREKGMLAAIPASTLAAVPRKYSSPQGDWVGVSAARVGARVQHLAGQALRTAELDPRTRAAALEGQGRLRPLGDRFPAADHLDHQARRRGGG